MRKKFLILVLGALFVLCGLPGCTDDGGEIPTDEAPTDGENGSGSAKKEPLDAALEWPNTLSNVRLLNRSFGKGKVKDELKVVARARYAETSAGYFGFVEDIDYDGGIEYFYVRFGVIYCAASNGDILWRSEPQNRINILGVYELCGKGNGFTLVVASDVSRLKFFDAATGELEYQHVFDTRLRIEAYNVKIGAFDKKTETSQLIFFPYSWDKAYMFGFEGGVKNAGLLWETDGIGKNDSYPATLMLADVWGTGNNDIVVCAHGRVMVYDFYTGKKLCEVKGNNIRNYGLCELRDIDGDGILEAAIICSQTETHVGIIKFDPKSEEGKRAGGRLLWDNVYPPGSVTISNAPFAFFDVDGDGKAELLYNINETADPGWYFMVCDIDTGEPKYKIKDMAIMNIVHMGGVDLFLMQNKTNGECGFYRVSGDEYEKIPFGDSLVFAMPYVYPLNVYDLYGTYQPYIGDFDGDGSLEILAGGGDAFRFIDYSPDSGFFTKSEITLENGSFNSLRRASGKYSFFSSDATGAHFSQDLDGKSTVGPLIGGMAATHAMTAADLNYDGRAELLAGGRVWSLEGDTLRELEGYNIKRTGYDNQYAPCIDELFGDGRKYIYTGSDGGVSLYDDRGGLVWSWGEEDIVYNMDIVSGHFGSREQKDIAAVVSHPNMGLNKIVLLDAATGEPVWESSDGHNGGTGLGPINYFLSVGDFDGDGFDDIIGVSHNYIMIIDGKTGEKLYDFAVLLEEIGASSYLGAGNLMIIDGIEEAEAALSGEQKSLKHGVVAPNVPESGVRHFYMQMTSNATGGRIINSDKGLRGIWINETGWMANPFGTPPLMTSPGIAIGTDGSFSFLQQFPDFGLKCQDGETGQVKWEMDINMQDITGIIACDIDNCGEDEFIFCASDNSLYVVGYDGKTKHRYDLGARGGMPIAADFDGDGYVEIAVTAQDGFIYILG